MIISTIHKSTEYEIDLNKAIDISIPLISGESGPKCFYAPNFKIESLVTDDFIGSTSHGSPVNFKNIFINPHGNGTHTECLGHITVETFTINQCLKKFHYFCNLLTVHPVFQENGDLVITKNSLELLLSNIDIEEVVIFRTSPNNKNKLKQDYSGTNPPYFSSEAVLYLNGLGVKHIMTDLPSVDKEVDEGLLAAHKAFWGIPDNKFTNKTITEMVFIENNIRDGLYFCNIQIASIEADASPSKILLFDVHKT